MFGGELSAGAPTGDTWEWNGTSWTEPPPNTIPAGRGTPLAFDRDRGIAVMYGGDALGTNTGETWEWDGGVWTRRLPASQPAPRVSHAIVYDEAHAVTLMYGGLDPFGGAILTDVWTWDGTNWTQQVDGPGGRVNPLLVYDGAHGDVVLFGGNGMADTWTWDGTAWTQQPTTVAPPPGSTTSVAAGAYDLVRQRFVVFTQNQTWEWDGITWTQASPVVSPPMRDVTRLTYDVLRGRVVMFGGAISGSIPIEYDDLWEWDGTTWTERTPATLPSVRTEAGVTYDTVHGELLMFGGRALGTYDNSTWRYQYLSGSYPPDRCVAGEDTDGDGLVDCADPDCWGRCSPSCPPGTTCDPTRPFCGDGTCSSVEDSVVCPQDCSP